MKKKPPRVVSVADRRRCVPVLVVWETTLACNLRCGHCGSRAGKRRPNELSTAECLSLVDDLARLRARQVVIIGGEAFLRKDWTEIVRAIASRGMICSMQTGGYNLTEERIRHGRDAGLHGLGVSIDGDQALHDEVRGVPGSYQHAMRALRAARDLGMGVSANTQIGPRTIPLLGQVMDSIIEAGARSWQVQLTVAMGNAVDNNALLVQPYQLLELMPLLARLARQGKQRGLTMRCGNNIGYYGPYESDVRGHGADYHWAGCSAGQNVMGIEADGAIKGCPSLATAHFSGGNIRDLSLEDIWNWSERIHFTRTRTADDLWGFCHDCYYADVCRAGCTWTSHSLTGRTGNNPYCYYRASELDKIGVRERIVKTREADTSPFGIGEFDILTEPAPGKEALAARNGVRGPHRQVPERLVQLHVPSPRPAEPPKGYLPPKLELCSQCRCHFYKHETACPHCGAAAPWAVPPPDVRSVATV